MSALVNVFLLLGFVYFLYQFCVNLTSGIKFRQKLRSQNNDILNKKGVQVKLYPNQIIFIPSDKVRSSALTNMAGSLLNDITRDQ